MKTLNQFEGIEEEELEEDEVEELDGPRKGGSRLHAAATTLGHYGGLKGGPARAKKLSPRRRREIARKGARARWND